MSSPVAVATVKKRRSRSVVKESEFLKPEVPTGLRRTTRIRSSSADAYQVKQLFFFSPYTGYVSHFFLFYTRHQKIK